MSSLEPLGIALLSAIAFAPSALAQDAAGADTATTDTAAVTTTDDNGTVSGKRIAIVGGGAILKPDSDPATGLDIDGGTAPTLSATAASWTATPTPAPVTAAPTAMTLQNSRLRPASQRRLNTG